MEQATHNELVALVGFYAHLCRLNYASFDDLASGQEEGGDVRGCDAEQGRMSLALSTSRVVMGLNIKNDETCLLARDLARLTGETMTGAITVALRERLAREERRRDAGACIEELLVIGRRCAESLEPGPSAVEHGDLLYDERGLPK